MAGRGSHHIMVFIFFIIVCVASGSPSVDIASRRHRAQSHSSAINHRRPHLGHQRYRLSSFRHPEQHRRGHSIPNEQQRLPATHRVPSDVKTRRQRGRHNRRTSQRHNRQTLGMPLMESFLNHPFHPMSGDHLFHPFGNLLFRPFHPSHGNPERWMERLRSKVENQMERFRKQMIMTPHHPKHHRLSRPHQQQHLPHRLTNRRQHHVQYHHPKKNHHSHSLHHQPLTSSSGTAGRRGRLYHQQQNGHRQFKVLRNPLDSKHEIPEDVEIFHRPVIPPLPVLPTPPTFIPTVPTIDSHGREGGGPHDRGEPPGDINCNTTHQRPPFHHTVYKTTSISHGTNNVNPIHSLGHHFTSIITEGADNPPFQISHSLLNTNRHHVMTPNLDDRFHHPSDLFNHPVKKAFDSFLPNVDNPSQSFVPLVKKHPDTSATAFESQHRSFKTNVEDHLTPLTPNSYGMWETREDQDEIPCIKCPPDTFVEAPRGTDCVMMHPPSPLSCTPRTMPEIQTVVTEGPAPGTLLPEGHYSMVITIMTSDATSSKPITTCKVNYDVEVRKCPQIPEIEGADVSCTAGRAWGSRCTWSCREGLILHGASATTCTGHTHPRWSRPAPLCIDPPSQRSPSPRPTTNPSIGNRCPKPPDTPGGHLVCQTPQDEFPPRRDLIPKDDPSVSGSLYTSQGDAQHLSATLTLALHPVGTKCRVECTRGRMLRKSESGRATLTCTPALVWDQRPPTCHLKVPPELRPGDCEDSSFPSPLSLPHLNALPLPVFLTASGDRARVTCDIQEVIPGLHYTRICRAVDKELETKATCQYSITSENSEPRCPELSAPEHGDLVCHEDDQNRLLCRIICNEGFQAPFSSTVCLHNASRWDFQSQSREPLPPCIPEGTYLGPDGILTPVLPKTPEERPDAPESSNGASAEIPKNTRFKTVADVFKGRVNHESEVKVINSGREYQVTDTKKHKEEDSIDEEFLVHENGDAAKENGEDWEGDEFVYYYDALGEPEVPDYYYSGYDESENDYAFGKKQEGTGGIGDYDSAGASVTETIGTVNEADDRTKEFGSRNEYEVKGLEEEEGGSAGREGAFLINGVDTGSGPTEVHFHHLGTMPKIMEEDTSDLFTSFHRTPSYPGHDFRDGEGGVVRSEADNVFEDFGGMNSIDNDFETSHANHGRLGNEDQDERVSSEWETHREGKHTLTKGNPKRDGITQHRLNRKHHGRKSKTSHHSNSWMRQNPNEINKDLEDDVTETEREKVRESEAPVMEAVLELEMLVADCERSNVAVEALTEALMTQEGCKALSCHLPHTTCRNISSNEGMFRVTWEVEGTYQPLEDYYYDDLQVPAVEAAIEALVVSTEHLASSEELTRTLEAYGAAIDLSSLTLAHLDLLCKQPGHGFDPGTNRCIEKKE